MASKATAEKWLQTLTETALANGWNRLDNCNSDGMKSITFARESEGEREAVTVLTFYNGVTNQVQRSAFATTRRKIKDISLRAIPSLLTSEIRTL